MVRVNNWREWKNLMHCLGISVNGKEFIRFENPTKCQAKWSKKQQQQQQKDENEKKREETNEWKKEKLSCRLSSFDIDTASMSHNSQTWIWIEPIHHAHYFHWVGHGLWNVSFSEMVHSCDGKAVGGFNVRFTFKVVGFADVDHVLQSLILIAHTTDRDFSCKRSANWTQLKTWIEFSWKIFRMRM